MSAVMKAVLLEFPGYTNLTEKKLYSIARSDRFNRAVAPTAAPPTETKHPTNTDLRDEATAMRKQGLRVGSIVEELRRKYPASKIPNAAALGRLIKYGKMGGYAKAGRRNSKVFKLTIETPNGNVQTEISQDKASKLIRELLGV
jgi:hypothetical protein